MIYTSNYKDGQGKLKTYSISKDKGKDADYYGDYYLALAPKEEFFRKWKNNRGIVDEIENNEYYMREFYHQILVNLNPQEIYNTLDNSILLCYENNDEFCHRHIVAAWLEYYLGIEVAEVKVESDKLVYYPRPKYIKDYILKLISENELK